ncbi:MAG: hypothetical protein Q8P50_12225 [Bacillota bacterium]|nr:hypothetical protein [Bacillota bacterium]
MATPVWVEMLGADPTEWLLASGEPAAVWVTRNMLESSQPASPALDTGPEGAGTHQAEAAAGCEQARQAVVSDPGTQELISRLPDWEAESQVSGHNSPKYAPNLLLLLSQMGVRGGDDERVGRVLDQMCAHQDSNSRFQSYGRSGHGSIGRLPEPAWGSLLCDSHAIVDVLVRFGRQDDPRVQAAVARMADDLVATAQGPGWPCLPHSISGFRGPGRKADFCPQVTVEALRALALLPEKMRPARVHDAVRTLLGAWRRRPGEQPYMFGHGYRFKTVKWPTFWYDVHAVLDTVAGYPGVWVDAPAGSPDRTAAAEMVACLIAYNFTPDGRVTPKSCYKGFESFSFGQKKRPSPFATARLAGLVRRFERIAGDIEAVDVRTLASSKGGSGTPVPPR